MGQKVHPYGFRVGYSKPWLSRWFARHEPCTPIIDAVRGLMMGTPVGTAGADRVF